MTVTWTLKAGLKWSDGEPLTCDDFLYAYEWVLDQDNVGVVTAGYEDITDVRVRLGHRDGPALRQDLRGLHHPHDSRRCPATTSRTSRWPTRSNGAGFRADEVANLPVSGAFKFESVTPGQELRLAKNPNYTSPVDAASRPTSTRSSSSGTATPTP